MNRILLWSLLMISHAASAGLVGTAFTYQGELQASNQPADGEFDLTFELFDAVTGGVSVAGVVALEDVVVSDGIFTAEIDFGTAAFAGDQIWVEIGVREGASSGAFVQLVPRQKLTATPYALHAEMVAIDAIGSSEIADGTVTGADVASNTIAASNIVDGPGSNLDADLLDGQQAADFAAQSTVSNNIITLNQHTNDISNNSSEISNNVADIDNLQSQIDALANQPTPVPTVLGLSGTFSSGRFLFGGLTGARAANARCTATFPANSDAHFCTPAEVDRALIAGNVPSSVNNIETWTIHHQFGTGSANESDSNTCQGLLSGAADLGVGITLTVHLNQNPGGSVTTTGDRVNLQANRPCSTLLRVMCCG